MCCRVLRGGALSKINRQPANPTIDFIGRSRLGEKRNHLLGRDLLRANLKAFRKLQKFPRMDRSCIKLGIPSLRIC